MTWLDYVLIIGFFLTQILYLISMMVNLYFKTRPVNRVDMGKLAGMPPSSYPHIVLFYPVLREPEETMATTMFSLDQIDYPKDRYTVVAIPNWDDGPTIAALERVAAKYSFLKIRPVPATSDPSWQLIWDAWKTPNAYWFHKGPRAGNRDLPPKKTRQLIYAFYHEVRQRGDDFLVNYIDADSAPPRDHFLAAAAGIGDYDVLQSRNVAGNLLKTMPASWFAFDHLVWDANKYGHLTADGKHPYWVLGKGLFFRARDLFELGGFHPWITIEDPEVGMRFWKNGKRLGLIDAPLIEEVPSTLAVGVKQRTRWVAGFFQSLNDPLSEMNFTRMERFKAWLNFIPCLTLWVNSIGFPVGIWAAAVWWTGTSPLPHWSVWLALVNITLFVITLIDIYLGAWRITKLVLPKVGARIWYMLRVNPVSLFIFWIFWMYPLWLGWRMYRKDSGLIWERTLKINAIEEAVRGRR